MLPPDLEQARSEWRKRQMDGAVNIAMPPERCRTAPEPAGVDYGEILKRADAISHCERMRRWLRASLVANLLLAAAVAGLTRALLAAAR